MFFSPVVTWFRDRYGLYTFSRGYTILENKIGKSGNCSRRKHVDGKTTNI
jgi:hypothetical protein